MKTRIAQEIMDRSELTLTPDLDVGSAIHKLVKAKLAGAPVLDADGRLCGMLTEKDCLRALVRQAVDGAPKASVRDYMTAPVETVGPKAQLLDIVHVFLTHPFRKVPVVDADERVLGQVSRRDILRLIDAAKDNPFLYGSQRQSPRDIEGVHSAMERARGKS